MSICPTCGAEMGAEAQPAKPILYSPAFETFWKHYPARRRCAKEKCAKYWMRNRLDKSAAKIKAGLQEDIQSEQWSEPQFIPLIYRYLHERRWEHEEDEGGKKFNLWENPVGDPSSS